MMVLPLLETIYAPVRTIYVISQWHLLVDHGVSLEYRP